jgi:hypothetical protein
LPCTNGSKPLPSPYAVWSASSSAQGTGQLSLPRAIRTADVAAAQSMPRMTGLGGYGAPEREASGVPRAGARAATSWRQARVTHSASPSAAAPKDFVVDFRS